MADPAFLNGAFLRFDEARVSAFDRGFLFGDGVYEVIPAYRGRLFRLEQHIRRLERSLSEAGIANPYPSPRWCEILAQLVDRADHGDLGVYLQVTRGVSLPRDHAFPEQTEPTVFAYASRLKGPRPDWLEDGVAAIVLEDIRWHRCDIKGVSLLGNVLLRQQAVERGAMEAILVREGCVTEGAATNIFLVAQGKIATPPKGEDLLSGITRDLIVELAQTDGLAVEERVIARDELVDADEVWISSTTKEVLPVTTLDERPVGVGRPGPLWKRTYELFQAYKSEFCAGSTG